MRPFGVVGFNLKRVANPKGRRHDAEMLIIHIVILSFGVLIGYIWGGIQQDKRGKADARKLLKQGNEKLMEHAQAWPVQTQREADLVSYASLLIHDISCGLP